MTCKVCSIDNLKLKDAIEGVLLINEGVLYESDYAELCESFPEDVDKIKSLSAHDCSMHFNFHQHISRTPVIRQQAADPSVNKNGVSLADDIGKDEASALYEMLNAQSATFILLNNRIANQIKDAEKEDGTKLLIHPSTTQFYKETADSIRATVRAIADLNTALNGQRDGSFDGLMALAQAMNASRAQATPSVKTHPMDNPDDGTTSMFDD